MNPILLKMLEREDQIPSNNKSIDAMLLSIIPPNGISNDSKIGSLQMYGPKKNMPSTSSYSHLFLCKFFLHEENQCLFYLMEGLNSNNELWKQNAQLQDDGSISI
eukprot:15325597-Ditylum_brightwellii.AAC.1